VTDNQDGVFDATQAALYLGLARATVVRYRQRGVLAACGKRGRSYLFAQAELDRFEKNRRTRGNPDWIASRKIQE